MGSGPVEAITWQMSVAEAGAYDLHVRYASTANAGDLRPLDVVINGAVQVAAQPFLGTGFQNWVTTTIRVTLEAGENAVTLAIPAGFSNGPNVDAVALTSVGAPAAFEAWQDAAPAFAGAAPAAIGVAEGMAGVIGDFAAAEIAQRACKPRRDHCAAAGQQRGQQVLAVCQPA